ncbi:biotin-dependent carboxyltransferase family protein [Demequina sediminicola]|uniref:5-oxoprolinase subunit C family protein n=1 Tax=Demequina sediminicola TaxID=1095026 RepID=UPI000783A785|nr:biotin-dependent carboxyltransferase family protein [Demequina sediminicola]
MIEVLDAGALLTVQDLGRPGYAHLGVSRSGAADALAAVRANTLVGNQATDAVLETTLTGAVLRFTDAATVALTGTAGPAFVGDVPAPMNRPVRLGAGQVLEIAPPERGLRTYVAVRGGIDVPAVLTSRSTDTLSGIGPAPLQPGDRLSIGESTPASATLFDAGGTPVPEVTDPGTVLALKALAGPRADWIHEAHAVADHTYTVTAESNRVGMRVDGPALEWARTEELASEGVVAGAIQVPPSGLPVFFLADHPTTGGYPVIGVLTDEAVALAAQCAPGQRVRIDLRDA